MSEETAENVTFENAGTCTDSVANNGSRAVREYLERVNKVLEYIEGNIGAKLSLGVLADVAGFSRYHFHRIFHSIVGVTLSDYVKQLRLAAAAKKLFYSPGQSITEIALDCGFTSPTDFARSFKAEFGMSAGQYRRHHEYKQLVIKSEGNPLHDAGILTRVTDLPAWDDQDRSIDSAITLINLPDYTVAYIRRTGLSREHRNPEIDKSFGKLYTWVRSHGYIGRETRVLGITLDNPEIIPLGKCRYDACMTVPDTALPEGEIGVRKLNSAGKYISYRFMTEPGFDKIFFKHMMYIYGAWLPLNGYMPDDRPFLEIYNFGSGPVPVSMDFSIPVKPAVLIKQ